MEGKPYKWKASTDFQNIENIKWKRKLQYLIPVEEDTSEESYNQIWNSVKEEDEEIEEDNYKDMLQIKLII